jgi:hypothetical protein
MGRLAVASRWQARSQVSSLRSRESSYQCSTQLPGAASLQERNLFAQTEVAFPET